MARRKLDHRHRAEEEKSDAWAGRMDAIQADVVMDLICYTTEHIYSECLDHLISSKILKLG